MTVNRYGYNNVHPCTQNEQNRSLLTGIAAVYFNEDFFFKICHRLIYRISHRVILIAVISDSSDTRSEIK